MCTIRFHKYKLRILKTYFSQELLDAENTAHGKFMLIYCHRQVNGD